MSVRKNRSVRKRLDALRAMGRRAICQFIIAGDPDPEINLQLIETSIATGVDVFEFCIPFKRSITDGPTIRSGYARALAAGVTVEQAFALMSEAAKRAPVVCLADFRETVRPLGIDLFLDKAHVHGAGAVLIHGLPPLMQQEFSHACAAKGLEQVGTVYSNSPEHTLRQSCANASAFLYLVSTFGKSGGNLDLSMLGDTIKRIKAVYDGPVAVGFGLKTPADHLAVLRKGADMTIMGSTLTAVIEKTAGNPKALFEAWETTLLGIVKARNAFHKRESVL